MKALGLALFLTLITVSSALAQNTPCGERSEMLRQLSNKYSEAPVAIGVANNGGLLEVLTTGDGETWSIIMTSPKGMSCLVAAGEGWRVFQDVTAMGPEA